ncbi:DUF4233 domain-containing protein [Marinactinospora rubrisoli]|uniref:DUF4233 domain-containing protein n=1 Tax=Marinactinospora rubrisoli TaxID=2715399 RepID=A0ABW2KLJ1_9ACTN
MRTMCAVVLAFEAVVIALAVPVAIQLGGYSPAVAGGTWGGLAAVALVLAALQRFAWARYAGWALQAAFVASGVLVPGLFVLGVVFAGLWVAGWLLGRRTDALRAAGAAQQPAGSGPAPAGADARGDG